MAIYRTTIKDRDFWITVEPVLVQRPGQSGFAHGGFAARISADVAPEAPVPEGFIPYFGEFIRESSKSTTIFSSEDAARDAATAEIERRLGGC